MRPVASSALLRLSTALCLAISSIAIAHPDPPGNPPVLTQVDVVRLVVVSTSDDQLTDGGEAEILVVVEIDWGGEHGSSWWSFQKEHVFPWYGQRWNAIGPKKVVAPSFGSHLDLMFGTGQVSTFPPFTNVASHFECSPATEPSFKVEVSELDLGGSWIGGLGAAMASDVAPVGGDTIAYLVESIGSVVNSDDVIPVGVNGASSGASRSEANAEIELRTASINLPAQPACGSRQTTLIFDGKDPAGECLAPPPPRGFVEADGSLVELPSPTFACLGFVSDEHFTATLSTLLDSSDPELPDQWRLYWERVLEVGVDDEHAFGRSSRFLATRFATLIDALERMSEFSSQQLLELEGGPASEILQGVAVGKNTAVGIAYLVAAQIWLDSHARNVDSEVLAAASVNMRAAKKAAELGRAREAIELYAASALRLSGSAYPEFNRTE